MCRLPARQAEVPSEREGVEPRCRCDQVGGPEPGDETQASVVKDRPSGDRGFAPTSPAHKAQASALPGCPTATDTTSESVGPTTLDQVAPTSRVIGKRRLELRQGWRERSAHSYNYEVVELSGQAPKGDRGSPLPACCLNRRLIDSRLAASSAGRGRPARITINNELNCDVDHIADPLHGEFYDETACATLVAVDGTLFGPSFIPAGGSASPRTTFTPVSQTQTGDGSAATPWTITTVVTLGTTGLTLTERDVYVSGAEYYSTLIDLQNAPAAPSSLIDPHVRITF